MFMRPNRKVDRTIIWLGVIVLLGIGHRAWLAEKYYPIPGDPTFSYAYRATLISEGDIRGIKGMWHPPGLPVILAALTTLSFRTVSPYVCGVGLGMAAYVGLAIVIDRLLKPRVESSSTRIVAACFIAFYEGLVIWAAGPLSEPIYLFAIYSAVLLLDRSTVSMARAIAAGVVVGLAFTIRFDAAAAAIGLSVLLLVRRQRKPLIGFVIGGLCAGGWLVADWEFMKFYSEVQEQFYTIPRVHGIAAQFKRLLECVYYGATTWLPMAILLPYWILSSYGLLHPGQASGRRSIHHALLAVVLPGLVIVGCTIMQKRSASFLLPAVAVWIAFGVEFLSRWFSKYKYVPRLIAPVVIALLVADVGRTAFRLQKVPPHPPASAVAASTLDSNNAPEVRVWAFGIEPEIYALRRQAIYYTYRNRHVDYQRLYLENQGRPEAFLAALRADGYRYLVTRIGPPRPRDPSDPSTYDDPLVRSDLIRIGERAGTLPLKRLPSQSNRAGADEVEVYELLAP